MLAGDHTDKYEDENFADISRDVAHVIEVELGGKFVGDGWREWKEAT